MVCCYSSSLLLYNKKVNKHCIIHIRLDGDDGNIYSSNLVSQAKGHSLGALTQLSQAPDLCESLSTLELMFYWVKKDRQDCRKQWSVLRA
jgi:hypothetical protein